MGWHLLLNENRQITRGSDTISIIGVKIFSKIDASNSTYTEYSNEQSSDDALSKVLKRIAGTYELVEDMGIYGFKTIYTG